MSFDVTARQRGLAAKSVHRRLLLSPLLLVLGMLAAGLVGLPRKASAQDVSWANDTIDRMVAAAAEQARERRERRGSAVERMYALDEEDDMAPRRRARRGDRTEEYLRPRHQASRRQAGNARVASLGRIAAPPPTALTERRGAAPEAAPRKRLGPMVASLGREFVAPAPTTGPSLTDGKIDWVASAGCLASALRGVLEQVAANFGPLRVNSTCRSRRHNAKVGGARRSFHLTGSAVDFRMTGNIKAVLAFLRSNASVGGLKHYGRGVFHIDTGPRRTW